MNIALIGLRGSGKTTLGPRVAAALGRGFIDLDQLIPAKLNTATVAQAWELHGESGFRKAEVQELGRMLKTCDDHIIALGGGTPTAPGAAVLMKTCQQLGTLRVVYLRGTAETLRARMAAADNAHRPSLTGKNPLDEIDAVLAARDPLYRSLADLVITIDGVSLDAAAAHLEAAVRSIAPW